MSIESRIPTEADLKVVENQLGRTPRDVHAISYRCPCGKPAVVETPPRLSNGEPFPTFYYATCPRLTAAISTLETTGMMESMTKRLETDAELAGAYAAAHDDYLAARAALKMDVPEVEGISAGGMPNRVTTTPVPAPINPHTAMAAIICAHRARISAASMPS